MEVGKINTRNEKPVKTDCDTQHFYVLPFAGSLVEAIRQYQFIKARLSHLKGSTLLRGTQ